MDTACLPKRGCPRRRRPDDEAALREDDSDLASVGPRGRAEASNAHQEGNEGDICPEYFHGFPHLRDAAAPAYLSNDGNWPPPTLPSMWWQSQYPVGLDTDASIQWT